MLVQGAGCRHRDDSWGPVEPMSDDPAPISMGRRGSNLRQPEAGGDGAGGQLCAASGPSRSCAGDEANV